jgi:hypothetical protein
MRLDSWLPTVKVKTSIQNDRVAIQLELAVTIHFFGNLKEPVHERTRPSILVQKIMENCINVKTIAP